MRLSSNPSWRKPWRARRQFSSGCHRGCVWFASIRQMDGWPIRVTKKPFGKPTNPAPSHAPVPLNRRLIPRWTGRVQIPKSSACQPAQGPRHQRLITGMAVCRAICRHRNRPITGQGAASARFIDFCRLSGYGAPRLKGSLVHARRNYFSSQRHSEVAGSAEEASLTSTRPHVVLKS